MILCVDLDDTLLKNDKTISKFTLNALFRWKEEGNLIIINTARNFERSIEYQKMINADYLICNAGADVYDHNQNLIDYHFLSQDNTIEIINKILPFCSFVRIQTIGELYTTDINDCKYKYLDINHFSKINATKIIINKGDYEKIKEITKAYDVEYVLYCEGVWARISPLSASKMKALKFIVDSINDNKDNVYGFGDDYGDIDFLYYCGHGYLMDNAKDEIKNKYCDISICHSNEEDGIGMIINEILNEGV